MKLEFKNVTKQYGEVNAVNKVNCVMEKGIYGTAWSKWSRKDHINAYALYDCSTIRRTNIMEW